MFFRLEDVGVALPVFGTRAKSLRSALVARLGLHKNRLGNRTVPMVEALKGINIEGRVGDRIALMGDNGSGKSTLLRVLGKIYHPTSGKIEIEGRIETLIDLSLGMNPEATGIENIKSRAGLSGYGKHHLEPVLDEIIEFAGLGNFIDMPLRTYSSGMQLRLAFATATAFSPEILLMDEWLAVGDRTFVAKAEERLEKVLEASKILVLATHDRKLMERVCNRGIWIKDGSVVADGPIFEICRKYFGNE